MGKVKVKRRGLSESTAQKGSLPKKKLNPFEIHVNRQKFDVIGQRSKCERGLPGISRSRAVMKRKDTLLKEYRLKDKSNKFFDRRIGEKDREMSYEDRVLARYTAERMKIFKKKQIYNLADDEILTHRGQTLSEIEKFDDPRSDEDEDETGKLGANFVGDAHFGGLSKNSEEGGKKSRKDLIEQLIFESKKRKAEKQRTKDQTNELTDKLDTDWQDLLPIVTSSQRKPTDTIEVEKPDSYDKVMRELKFEARGQASEPLKTEDEIQQEKKEKRAQLEAERKKRMQADVDTNELSSKHRSADDLDDGFAIDDEPNVTLSYDFEGNLLLDVQREKIETEEVVGNIKLKHFESPVMNKDPDEDDNSSLDNSGGDDDDDDDDIETDDALSDLKPLSDSEVEQDNNTTNKIKQKEDGETEKKVDKSEDSKIREISLSAERKEIISNQLSESEKRKVLHEVRIRSPNFDNVPEKYETLQKILKLYDAEKQCVILSHIIDKNHISLHESNRTRLETLFKFLLQHINDCSSQSPVDGLKVLNFLAPLLHNLARISPENTSQCVLDVLKGKQEEFQKHQRKYPTFDSLIIFKIISLLYPTSDFRHPVVTPSIVFMCQMLFQCRIKSRKDISKGLFLVTMFLEFTVLSKRFSPAAVNFLCGILHLAIPKKPQEVQNVLTVPPFRKIGFCSELLVLESQIEDKEDKPLVMKITDLMEDTIDIDFKIRALSTALSMLKEFHLNLNYLLACPSIFIHASVLLSKVPLYHYPKRVQSEIEMLSEAFHRLKDRTVQYLVIERKRPKALRLYEPSFQQVFDGKRRKPMGEEKLQREKLLHQIKREKKSAIREIRLDNAFLSKVKWKETMQSDMERKQKVKEIFGSASNQLGELRAYERKKKSTRSS